MNPGHGFCVSAQLLVSGRQVSVPVKQGIGGQGSVTVQHPLATVKHPSAAVHPSATVKHYSAVVHPSATVKHPSAVVHPSATVKHPSAAVHPSATVQHPNVPQSQYNITTSLSHSTTLQHPSATVQHPSATVQHPSFVANGSFLLIKHLGIKPTFTSALMSAYHSNIVFYTHVT